MRCLLYLMGEPPGSLRGSLWGAGDWPPLVNEKATCFEDGWKLLWNPVGWCKNMWDVATLKGFGGRWTPDIDCPDQDPAAADLRDADPGDSDPTEEDPGDEDPSDEDTTDEGPAGPDPPGVQESHPGAFPKQQQGKMQPPAPGFP